MIRYFMCILLVSTIVLVPTAILLAGTLIEDFDDGDMEGWERSPQNEDNKKVFWGVKDGAMVFDPEGQAWDQAISQLNFVGTSNMKVREWTDYDLEVDLKHEEKVNYPGGIRARVDLDTGEHYAIWLYPASGEVKLYKNPGWDINTGLGTVGQATYQPEVDEFHTLKLSCHGDTIKVFYDGKEIISGKDSDHPKGTIALDVQDRVVHFDNVKVTGAEIPNWNMSPVEPTGKLTTTWGRIKNVE